jgi:mannose-1-phosphate guanylyltransferase
MRLAGMILGAGLGSRMRHLTADTPKPLLELSGQPLLGHLLGRLGEAGVSEIYVNLYYRANQMRDFLATCPTPVPVHARREPRLTGPAGALRLFADELQQFDTVLVASADVLVGESLRCLVATHTARPASLTFACVQVRQARRYGVPDIGPDDEVRAAVEKPDVPDDETHWVSAGVYCLDPRVIDDIPPDRVYDYAKDLAPALRDAGKRVRAHRLSGYWRDVGTPQALAEARQDASRGRIPWLFPGRTPEHLYTERDLT